jgi:hypothetical protein
VLHLKNIPLNRHSACECIAQLRHNVVLYIVNACLYLFTASAEWFLNFIHCALTAEGQCYTWMLMRMGVVVKGSKHTVVSSLEDSY